LIRIDASILATVLVRGLRTARRAGVGLAEQAHRANTGLVDYRVGLYPRMDRRIGDATRWTETEPLSRWNECERRAS
jgi:hypothetical protein